jgi:hypothetical protein
MFSKPAEWVAPTQYGVLIAKYCYGETKWREALVGLTEIQRAWVAAGKPAGVLLSIFVQLHQQDAMEDRGFTSWKDDTSVTVAVPGKLEALTQLSACVMIAIVISVFDMCVFTVIAFVASIRWFAWLAESDDDDEDEDETEDEDDDDNEDEDEVRRIAARGMAEATITWQRALKSKGVQTLEDPLLGTPVDKATYQSIYGTPSSQSLCQRCAFGPPC